MTYSGTKSGKTNAGMKINFLQKMTNLIKEYQTMKKVTIDLNINGTKDNDPFFHKMTESYYKFATGRRRRMPIIKEMSIGVALLELPIDFNTYFMLIESSARRNYKKSIRNEYTFSRFNYNERLDDIWDINRSTTFRQGEMPKEIIDNKPKPVTNGISTSNLHDYLYYGVFDNEDKLVSYLGIMLAGDIAMIGNIYGHAAHQSNGIVPHVLVDGAKHIMENFPKVKYYGYGTYYGASDSLRRFKRKFGFNPKRVKWVL